MRLRTAIAALVLMTTAATAQDHTMHAMGSPAATDLPPVCLANSGETMGNMAMGSTESSGDDAHRDMMDGMDRMNADMMAGGTASDIDVAFVCSMIPHHRGAIDMAKAELAHGDDPWARTLAEGIIAAQEKEIADILAWLDGQK